MLHFELIFLKGIKLCLDYFLFLFLGVCCMNMSKCFSIIYWKDNPLSIELLWLICQICLCLFVKIRLMMNVSFQPLWVNTKEQDPWIVSKEYSFFCKKKKKKKKKSLLSDCNLLHSHQHEWEFQLLCIFSSIWCYQLSLVIIEHFI